MSKKSKTLHRVVIVGGGAGGLELATRLGKTLGRKKQAEITLVDAERTHIWKPLLHEIAAGTLSSQEEVVYQAQAHWCHFRFRLGYMDGLNRAKREIYVSPLYDEEGQEILPRRTFSYDTLVIGVGSVSNSFGIPGVEEHCYFLDTTPQAYRFQKHLLEFFLRTHAQPAKQLSIAIIGAGATGVELTAELHEVTRLFNVYGVSEVAPERDIRFTLIEASPRLLPALPEALSKATEKQLKKLGVYIETGKRVVEVTEQAVKTHDGEIIPADIKVWAAGIKAPAWLNDLDGLETNRLNQLVVRQTLQTTHDENVFALGDCAACPWPGHDQTVPPRAQAAHQQASLLYKSIRNRLKGKALSDYHYRDYGSLIALGKYTTVGNLMGNLLGSVTIGGLIARLVYLSLYKMHQLALYGPYRTGMLTLANVIRRSTAPRVKLH